MARRLVCNTLAIKKFKADGSGVRSASQGRPYKATSQAPQTKKHRHSSMLFNPTLSPTPVAAFRIQGTYDPPS